MFGTEGLEVFVSLQKLPFVLMVGNSDGVFFLLFLEVLAGFCAAVLFEAEFFVVSVGLLSMPFAASLFFSARSAAVPQCEFRGPFEVKAVGKEKVKGASTSCFWGVFRIQAWAAAFSRAFFCVEDFFLIQVAVCRYETASMLMLFAAEALSMLISVVGVLLICVGHALEWRQQQ